jgi:hypothetical protein
MNGKAHWEDIYSRNSESAVSWFQEHLSVSLDLIARAGLPRDAAIIDVGGGSSTLIDDLL